MDAEHEATQLDIREYLSVLRRRKWWIAVVTLLCTAAAIGASAVQTPMYEARAELLIQSQQLSLFNSDTGQRSDPVRALQTEIQVLQSQPVRDLVEKKFGSAPEVKATPVGLTDVIAVSATSTNAATAAQVANTYARSYIDYRQKQAVDALLAAGEQVQAKITQLETDISDLNRQVDQAPAGQRDAVSQSVSGRRNTLLQQQAVFRQRLDQLQVDASLRTGNLQLVTPATAPTVPVSPKPVRNGALALVVGLMLGIGVAFLRERLDDSLRGKEDLERAIPGVPVLGLIPALDRWKNKKETHVITREEPTSPAAEAYRALRTSVQFLGLDRPLKTLQITSPSSAEGKSTTITNLAVALGQAGLRVVVVDCDLRRPRLHSFVGVSNDVGFTSILLGQRTLADALQSVPGEERVAVLPSGPIPPNPSELLASRRTVELFADLQTHVDMVLIDCPPVLPVTDAAVLSSRVDATLLVTSASDTTRGELKRAVELLRQVEAPLIGVVLNGVSTDADYGYAYQYKYYRTEPPKASSRRRGA